LSLLQTFNQETLLDTETGRFSKKMQALKSTLSCICIARATSGFTLIDALHAYVYGRWPYWYIGVATGELAPKGFTKPLIKLLFNFLSRFPADNPKFDEQGIHPENGLRLIHRRRETFADTYHGKVVRLSTAKKLISIDKNIRLTDLEKVVPYSTARDLILESPDHILTIECPCRSARSNPCLPLDVCLVVGEPFASFAAAHHAERSRWIDRKEANDILVVEAERGHVHHAFFKEAAFGRFFAVCTCCCGAIQAQRNGIPMLASSGYVCVIKEYECSGCGVCMDVCLFGAARLVNGKAKIDTKACMGCGICVRSCPDGALNLRRDNTRSDALELNRLLIKNDDNGNTRSGGMR
jgi:ferredoxin